MTIIEKYLPDLEQIKKIRETLKQCKEEWLETKPGPKGTVQKFLGVNTVRQILDHAVDGITYWDFYIEEQWREEVYKLDKSSNQWVFDGYVYHVRGSLFIPGLGTRTQFGSKVAVGGRDNQDSAYKAAASNCLVKCSALFGVGEDLYSKIKVSIDDDEEYAMIQNDPNYIVGSAPGFGYQPNAWMNQGQPMPPNSWANQWNQPAPQPQSQPQPIAPEAQPAAYTPSSNQTEAKPVSQVSENGYSAQPKTFGEPVNYHPQESAIPKSWDQHEIQRIHQHKARLNIQNDEDMNMYVRDFLKNKNATINDITPENLKAFNDYLDKIAV